MGMMDGRLGRLWRHVRPPRAADAPDELGESVARHAVGEDDARGVPLAQWFFAVWAVGATLLNFALVAALVLLMPLKEVLPLFLQSAERSEMVVEVAPLSQGLPGRDLLVEKMVREYVVLRNTIYPNPTVMAKRWGEGSKLWHMTATKAYGEFRDEMQVPLKEAGRRGITRTVEILSDPIPLENGFYQVDFRTRDVEDGVETVKEWTATLLVRLVPREVAYEDRYINPIGFEVVDYAVRPRAGA